MRTAAKMMFKLGTGGIACITMSLLLLLAACSKEDASAPVSSVQVIPVTDTLKGIIGENTLLTNNRTWYIDGWVYVANEAALSIEPGTLLKVLHNGEKDINGGVVITRGAKIIATGTEHAPITLTCVDSATVYRSVNMGIVLLGRSPVKEALAIVQDFAVTNGSLAYGGQIPEDSSGVLQHIQIIYPYTQNKPVGRLDSLRAGLFLMGTGNRTMIRDIVLRQVTPDLRIKLR